MTQILLSQQVELFDTHRLSFHAGASPSPITCTDATSFVRPPVNVSVTPSSALPAAAMNSPVLKRRRIASDAPDCADAVAVLDSAFCAFLAAAQTSASLAAHARKDAAATLVGHVAGDISALSGAATLSGLSPATAHPQAASAPRADAAASPTRELSAVALERLAAVETAASEAIATVSALALKFGTVVAEASDVEVAVGGNMVSQSPTGPVASRRSRSRETSILDLPDGIIERLFEILDPDNGRDFPCGDRVRSFAFSCSRFANIYRQSFVKEIVIFAGLQTAEAALRYHEAVSGALSRFTSIEKVWVTETGCLSRDLISYLSVQQAFIPGSGSVTTYENAVAARKSFGPAVTAGSSVSLSNVKSVEFNCACSCHVSTVLKQPHYYVDIEAVWDWKAEKEQWLDFFPNARTVQFHDFSSFCSSSRLCGTSSRADVTALLIETSVSRGSPLIRCDISSILSELTFFGEVEMLFLGRVCLLTDMDQRLPVSSMVAALPNLQKLCVSFYVTTLGSGPILEELLGDPQSLHNRRLKISVLVLGWKTMFENNLRMHSELQGADPAHFTAPGDLAELQLEGFRSMFLNVYQSDWEITEVHEHSVLGIVDAVDIAVVATFREG